MFFLGLLSKLSKFLHTIPYSPARYPTKPCLIITESVKQPSVFRHRQLPYHLVQRCFRRSANRPDMPSGSRWNRHPIPPFDIQDAFTTKPLPWTVQVTPQVGPYRHPNHKSRRLTRSRFPSSPWSTKVQANTGRQGSKTAPRAILRNHRATLRNRLVR